MGSPEANPPAPAAPDALGTLGELAQRIGGRVVGDPSTPVERVAAVDDAGPGSLTFAVDERYLRAALASKAAAVLTEDALVDAGASYPKPLLAVPSPRVALAALLAALEPPRPQGPFVHPTAAVHPSAQVGEAVWIGPHVAVGPRARIGDRTVLQPGVVVGVAEDARLAARLAVPGNAALVYGDRRAPLQQAVRGREADDARPDDGDI